MNLQESVFAASEGNAWFARNSVALAAAKFDPILSVLEQYSPEKIRSVESVCDIGCADGSRLRRFHELFPHVGRLAGFDASHEAIIAGMEDSKSVDLRQGVVSSPPFDEQFDVVIVSFVLSWIDRSLLARTIQAIDTLVRDGGILIVADFLPDKPHARRYHHRPDVEMFTYKQDYPGTFSGLGTYHETIRVVHHHGDASIRTWVADDGDRAVCSLLEKALAYPVVAS